MTREQYLTLAQEAYDGGFTVDLDGDHPESGYAIAVPGYEQRGYLKPGTVTLDGIASWIEGYVVQHGAKLRKPARYLGAWRDGNNLVLDVVQVIGSETSAALIGRLRGQDAIYHLDTGKTITLHRDVVTPKQRIEDDDNGRGDERWEDDGGR